MNIYDQKILDILNEERVKKGLSQIKVDARLCQSSCNMNRDMADGLNLNDFSTPRGFIKYIRNQTGGNYKVFGQIVTMGSKLEHLISNIKKCSGHNGYIYDPRYTHLGINIYSIEPRIKLVTLHFGG